jgi:fucose permease
MSLFSAAFLGMMPLGSLLAGFLASKIGAPSTVFISGVFCLVSSFLFMQQLPEIKKHIHPIYVKLGISPEGLPGV